MKRLDLTTFNIGGLAQRLMKWGQPPEVVPMDHRPVDDVLTNPAFRFYDPNALHFPEAMLPTVPGNGGYISAGLGMVEYDNQPTWDRSDVAQCGPVQLFFNRMMYDNRIKSV